MVDFDFILFDFMLRLVLVEREEELVGVPVPVERRSRLLPMLDPSGMVVVRVSVWVLMVPPRCISRESVPFCIVPVPVLFCIVPVFVPLCIEPVFVPFCIVPVPVPFCIEPVVVVVVDWAEAVAALNRRAATRVLPRIFMER